MGVSHLYFVRVRCTEITALPFRVSPPPHEASGDPMDVAGVRRVRKRIWRQTSASFHPLFYFWRTPSPSGTSPHRDERGWRRPQWHPQDPTPRPGMDGLEFPGCAPGWLWLTRIDQVGVPPHHGYQQAGCKASRPLHPVPCKSGLDDSPCPVGMFCNDALHFRLAHPKERMSWVEEMSSEDCRGPREDAGHVNRIVPEGLAFSE